MITPHANVDTKKFLILSAAGILGAIAVSPYTIELAESAGSPIDIPTFILSTAINILILTWLGLKLAKVMDLDITPVMDKTIRPKEIMKPSIIAGLIAATLIIIISNIEIIMTRQMPDIEAQLATLPSAPSRFLASFYGGITEELMMRLFLLTLIAFIITATERIIRKRREWKPGKKTMTSAIIISAIVFGIGHLPAAALSETLTPILSTKIIILNSIGGIIFGWLYKEQGLESAMTAHFTADIILHLVWPAILAIIFL